MEDCGEGSSSGPFDSIKVMKKDIDILSKGALAELVSLKPMTSSVQEFVDSYLIKRPKRLSWVAKGSLWAMVYPVCCLGRCFSNKLLTQMLHTGERNKTR